MQVWNVLHAAHWKIQDAKFDICASSQLRHVSTIGNNLLNSNISSTCPHNMVNFGPLTAEIGYWRFGAPQQTSTGFVSWLRYFRDLINSIHHHVGIGPHSTYLFIYLFIYLHYFRGLASCRSDPSTDFHCYIWLKWREITKSRVCLLGLRKLTFNPFGPVKHQTLLQKWTFFHRKPPNCGSLACLKTRFNRHRRL